ncbi:MAG: hypothetical protein ACI8O8_001657 [Oleiphilaceae bacterium]|jgi:hypothetical protein
MLTSLQLSLKIPLEKCPVGLDQNTINKLKINKYFIDRLPNDLDNLAIVQQLLPSLMRLN